MNILSLFDGISCGQIALHRAGKMVANYYASEINSDAIKVTQYNFPQTVQLGDVKQINTQVLPKIDLLIGGSPCTSFSIIGKQTGFNGQSGLFYEYYKILKATQPTFFLLENVKMKKEFSDEITRLLNVQPVEIDSADFSAQTRKRLYWTNIPISKWQIKNLYIQDILESGGTYEWVTNVPANNKFYKNYMQYDTSNKGHKSHTQRAYYTHAKMGCLTAESPHAAKILIDNKVRKTTRLEHERLQTLPPNYTSSISLNKAKKAIGNGWTVDVIAHIFSGLP